MKISMPNVSGVIVDISVRYPVSVILVAVLGAVLSLIAAATQLEFHTSRLDLIAAGDRYKQLDQAYEREFEDPPERIIAVIRAEQPETAKAFATALGQRWEQEPTIEGVLYRIDVGALQHKALLYLSPEELTTLRHKLQDHQDLLQELATSPTLQNLFALINWQITQALVGHVFTGFLAEEGEPREPADFSLLLALLQEMHQWLEGRRPFRSPWERWFAQDAEAFAHDGFLWSEDKQLLFVLANPKAAIGEFNRYEQAVQRIRADVRELQRVYPGVDVGITGKAVLDADEMGVAQRDTTIASLIALVGVALLFAAFFKGVARPAFVVITLVIGLSWSLGFTILSIGHLNIFTIIFAPMLIGLGDGYGIHFISRYEEERARCRNARDALERTLTGTGGGITTAALTMAAAFYMLFFTGFKGLSELGFITGSGLLLMFLATFMILPALLVLDERWRGAPTYPRKRPREEYHRGYVELLYRFPRATLAVSTLFAGLSLLALGRVRADFNLLHLQSAETESVIWVEKIFESTKRSLLYGELVAESPEEVRRKTAALQALPSVARVDSIASVIPEDQERQLHLIEDLRPLLADLALPRHSDAAVDVEALTGILGRIAFKMAAEGEGTQDAEAAPIHQEMQDVRRLSDAVVEATERLGREEALQALSAFQAELRRDLAEKLALLQENLRAEPLTIADLPPTLRQRYVGKTGHYRLFVFPTENIWEFQPLARFVADLQSVDPDALGTPVMNFAYLSAIIAGYTKAGLYAFVGVAFLAFLAFRELRPTVLALIPLSVGAVWTLGLMALWQVPLNVGNLLFLPLVMGIGIDNGIYVVHRFWTARDLAENHILLDRSTGQAITLASLTTMVGFGSLMISSHRGIHSLGLLVTLGVGSVLLASLTVLPSLLAVLAARAGKRAAWMMDHQDTAVDGERMGVASHVRDDEAHQRGQGWPVTVGAREESWHRMSHP
jgi:uncharacterized protein